MEVLGNRIASRHGLARWLGCIVLLFACSHAALAQRVTSDLLGVVKDPSGALVPDAAITLTEIETGRDRQARTDSEGNYVIPAIPAGHYQLHVVKTGFAESVLRNIEVEVNDRVVLNVDLALAGVTTVFEVDGNGQILETANSAISSVVSEETLSDLPLNGRDLFQLTLLQPGVLPVPQSGPNPWANGGFGKASVQGARPTMNNVNLDGADINDPGFNIPPGGATGTQMGVEAVREFRVLLANYGAEFGRNAGGNIQLITKSGTNQLHGSVFEYHRNAALDARNFFDGASAPPFVRNQFGAALGGPIRRNRVFYFANIESLLESKSITQSLSVPDANAHRGYLPSLTNPASLVFVGIDPRIVPFMALYPLPNAGSSAGGVGTLNTSARQPTRSTYGLFRLDSHLSDRDDFFFRYAVDDSTATVPFLSTAVPGFPGRRDVRNQYGILNWQRVVSPNLVNEVKFGYTRPAYVASAANQYPLSTSLIPNRPLGLLNVGSLPALGNNVILPFGTTSNVYEGIDNVIFHRGRHEFKVGGDFKRYQINGVFDLFSNGIYAFTDLTPFGIPSQSANPALEAFMKAIPLAYIGVDPQLSDSARGFRQNYTGLYAADDFRVSSNLVLNLGLRWEYWSNPSEVNGRLANIRNVLTDKSTTVGPIWASVPKNLYSPRFGFAYTPTAGSKTVIRGGFGLLRDQLWANLYFDVRFYEPFYRPLQYVLPNFTPSPRSKNDLIGLGGPPSVIGSFGITYNADFPYYLQYNLNVQRELSPNLLLQVGYVGSHGIHLVRGGEANPFSAARGTYLNPNFGSLPLFVTDAQSFYNSGQVSLLKRLSSGLQFQASYTLSRSIDDQSGSAPSDFVNESGFAQNLYNRKGDRGRSSFDRKHAFMANGLFDVPFGPNKRWLAAPGSASQLLRDWTVGGILTMYSGAPFTANLGSFNNSVSLGQIAADRPDVRPGARACDGNSGGPGHWFDPAIFALPAPGAYGNSGRNTLCGPALTSLDASLTRRIRLTERLNLQFRAEVFNALNKANFDVPVNTQGPSGSGGNGDAVFVGRRSTLNDGRACTAANDASGLACGILAPNAGQIFRTVTPSRQIQFALKLTF